MFQWTISMSRTVLGLDNLHICLLGRNKAYKYWVPTLPLIEHGAYGSSHFSPKAVIIAGGYLIRSVVVHRNKLTLRADFNATAILEVIGVPTEVKKLEINGERYKYKVNKLGNWKTTYQYRAPHISVPSLDKFTWNVIDSLPEIQPEYDDDRWPSADHVYTNNTIAPLQTEVSLFGSDYGFHTGVIGFRGHFVATGYEESFYLSTQGRFAYGTSV